MCTSNNFGANAARHNYKPNSRTERSTYAGYARTYTNKHTLADTTPLVVAKRGGKGRFRR